ncbi:MAG: glycosyltransferase family 39 protein [Sphingobacteriales bacterium]|nr:MAG: glycosyltransferase family 39 protein [Sphingobacteriales bacterium]
MPEPIATTLPPFSKTDRWLIAAICILLLIALTSHLHVLPLRAEEPRRALVALEMELSGNYIAPTINGVFYYNKPPVYNWFLVLLYKITGSYDEWVVRLPGVISLIALGLFHFFATKRHTDPQTALLSALFLVTSADILFYFSLLGEIDLFYTLLVYLQIIAIFHFYQTKQYGLLFAVSYFFAGIGLLTKGLPSLLFQGLTGLGLVISEKNPRLLFRPQHLAGILIFLLTTGLYFYQYSKYNDVGLYFAKLLSESTERTMMEKSFFQQIQHLFWFPVMFLKILAPYILFLPLVFHKSMRQAVLSQPLLKFSLMFIVANIWIYWLSPGTKDRYLYMFLPFCCTILAFSWNNFPQAMPVFRNLSTKIIGAILILLSLASLATAFLPQTKEVRYIYLLAPVFGGLFAALFWAWKKNKTSPVLLLILAVVLLRIEFNITIIPIQLPEFRENAVLPDLEKIMAITNRQPVCLAGREQTLHVETFGIGGSPLVAADLMQPPVMLFRISYYLAKETGQIMEFHPTPQSGRYYLAEKSFAETISANPLHEFFEPRNKINYVLFKAE